VIATSSTINIQNCTFNDILSYNKGGAFNLVNNIYVEGTNLFFNNVTSLNSVLIKSKKKKKYFKKYIQNFHFF